MKKFCKRTVNFILIIALAGTLALQAEASSVSELQKLIEEQQKRLNELDGTIGDIEDAQDLLEEEISDLNAEVLNTMTSIGLLEDEIAVKLADIETAQAQYNDAKEKEEAQYEAMKVHIQFMYEQGDTSYLSIFLGAESFSDIINRAMYIEELYKYDRKILTEYENTKNEVAALWAQLEEDKASLETDKVSLEEQKVHLDGLLAKKKAQSDNYEAQIAKARQEASVYKKKIQQEQAQIKKLEEQAKKKISAANGTYTVTKFDTSVIDKASGSDLGKKIAKYACQYIGYPYVSGGTSLTNGADCSGFTYRVYSDFNYSLPRTSYQQRSAGKEVSFDEAQPGDLVCYDGHVGIYVGGGYIVHASSERTGIKTSKATYRTILSVRRII